MTPQVKDVCVLTGKKLRLTFDNDETRVFDVTPYISGPWYGELSDDAVFNLVRPSGRTVVWPDGQDIAPHELYELSVPV